MIGGMGRAAIAAGLVGALLTVRPGVGQAQGVVSLTAWAGGYVPTQNRFSLLGNDIKRRNSLIGGARITVWGRGLVGVEMTAGVSPARTTFAGATVNADRNTNVFVGAVKMVLGVSPARSGASVFIGGGPAIIRRGRDLLREDGSHTDLGGVVGLGVRLPLASHVALRIDGEAYIYGGDFDGTRKRQNDLVLTAGPSFSF